MDENEEVAGYELEATGLDVSVQLSGTKAGELAGAVISVDSPRGFPAGATLTLASKGNFSFSATSVISHSAGNSSIQIQQAGKDLITVAIGDDVVEQRLEIVLGKVLVAAVPGATGAWQAYTQLQGASMAKNDAVTGVTVEAGSRAFELIGYTHLVGCAGGLCLLTSYKPVGGCEGGGGGGG